MEARHTSDRVGSEQYRHADTCDLFSPYHTIPEEVAEVVEAFDSMDGHRAVAAGCNTCTSHALHEDDDVDAYIYYVAQMDGGDSVFFGYGGTDSKAAAYTLIGLAEELGVSHEWNGETTQKVLIGGE